MSKIGELYLKLKEQADYFDMDLDFETLEFIEKQPAQKETWRMRYLNRDIDFDPRMDVDRE